MLLFIEPGRAARGAVTSVTYQVSFGSLALHCTHRTKCSCLRHSTTLHAPLVLHRQGLAYLMPSLHDLLPQTGGISITRGSVEALVVVPTPYPQVGDPLVVLLLIVARAVGSLAIPRKTQSQRGEVRARQRSRARHRTETWKAGSPAADAGDFQVLGMGTIVDIVETHQLALRV